MDSSTPPKPDAQYEALRAELIHLSGTFPVLKHMIDTGMPLNRDTYVSFNWGPDRPDPWTAEHEGEIPEPLQDWSQLERNRLGE